MGKEVMENKSAAMWAALNVYVLAVVVVLCVGTSAEYAPDVQAVHRYGWQWQMPAPVETQMELVVALKHDEKGLKVLEEKFWALSDPSSPSYGQYMSLEELGRILPQSPKAKEVADYFSANGGRVQPTQNGDFLHVVINVGKAEQLFECQLHTFLHPTSKFRIVRAMQKVTMPKPLDGHVDFISGLHDFPPTRSPSNHPQHSKRGLQSRENGVEGPDVYVASGVPNGVIMDIAPYCKNGQQSTNASRPCADFPPVVSHFIVSANNVTKESPIMCHQDTANSISCHASWCCSENYENLSIAIATVFEDGTVSQFTEYLTPVIPHDGVTPRAIRNFYSIPDDTTSSSPSNTQAVAEFNSNFSYRDLAQFLELTGMPPLNVTIVGPNYPDIPDSEASLDVQLLTAVGTGVNTAVWSVPSVGDNPLFRWIVKLANSTSPPLVNSISYGIPEKFMERCMADRLNVEFQKLAVRGVSVITTSGDAGVSDGLDCSSAHADFPSSSPYTTSLGATRIDRIAVDPICNAHEVYGVPIQCAALAEVPCSTDNGATFTTGGSFSSFYTRPSYQDKLVLRYLKKANLPPSNFFNSSGRAYNDVAALGSNVIIVLNGKIRYSGGTSASGPIFAGVVGLLNEVRLKANKSPLGFLNPLLYKIAEEYPSAFNNVRGGNNRCGYPGLNGESECCNHGFDALDGWDPMSGLGSPNYAVLAAYIASM